MIGYPDDIWRVSTWTLKFPGDIWTAEIWTVKSWTAKTRLGWEFLLWSELGLVLGLELVLGLGLGLVITVQFMTVQTKTGNHGTAAPHFGPRLLWPNGWMDQDAIWYGGRPRPRPHCVRQEPSSPHKGHSRPQFSAGVNCGQMAGWIKMPLGTREGLSAGDILRRHVQIDKHFEPSTVLWTFHTIQPSSYGSNDTTNSVNALK